MCLPNKSLTNNTVPRLPQLDDFLLACTYNSSYERVEIEIEIVRVWLLNTHGIQLRRKSGSTWLYKQLYSSIVNALILD
jgi:hypothetical protein